LNLESLGVEGEPQTLVNGVLMGDANGAYYAVSAGGTLAYVPTTATADPPRTLVWVDRKGNETPLNAPARPYQTVRLSPDGQRIAVTINDEQRDVWTWDLERQTLTRITTDPRLDGTPIWSPDGNRLIFNSRREGGVNLYVQAADGTGVAQRLTDGMQTFVPTSMTPDGTTLLGLSSIPKPWTLFMLPLNQPASPQPLLPSPSHLLQPAVSPDGRMMAYFSDESGRLEVYVRPFPEVNAARLQVSTAGGDEPHWSRDGRELFFFAAGRLVAARIETVGGRLRASVPVPLFGGPYFNGEGPANYDVSADGQRFLMIKQDPAARPPNTPIVMVLNALMSLRTSAARR
jgi:serine/threonine-protein kinase